MKLDNRSREELIKLVQIHAKNWLAHDGCWFLAAEERFGIGTAIELDTRAWECFSPIELNPNPTSVAWSSKRSERRSR